MTEPGPTIEVPEPMKRPICSQRAFRAIVAAQSKLMLADPWRVHVHFYDLLKGEWPDATDLMVYCCILTQPQDQRGYIHVALRHPGWLGERSIEECVRFAALGSLTWNQETSIDTTNIGAINLNDWKEIGTNLNHEEYHPPAESEEATIYDTTTRLYQFSFGMASNTSLVEPAATGGVYGEWRPAIFAVTQATVSPNASQSTGPPRGMPVLCTAWCPVVMTCSAWLTTDLWLFPGDARVPPTEKFRFWVQYGGYNLTDATAYVRVRTLAFKA